ncbi:pantoate--beta-alanine ligase [Aneurinibacillus aneurinilyticus]|uniref:Pantothenate synthetase n=1 Tax=Aneurinibacillus aneurinilyticus ATCC 12856 TaxID=649747 RepID=U1X1D4_ANEAE|nr:pantoate--beta-alanine ligase [Aneurinibacillus aneurinilyticus]ERI08323.1 pantoate--beta-alanine ligase [Aneurinibacillus aneurinilyticus ATCC 12856]MED0705736.1 pantoate--beta-alanine ligase [Aneurinibacillus aneurinilyticus]MED0725795.1 pantoate--beta-alanine ligase [Aneurinibacillus aneurinilyticus]MED0732142.1 pantoate--beta-alanine ligase [Aneurinibacillus aneurinilyticus]MED0740772.1 pantoate--beta-alanine ligase [Aneurinibacillus aneurinilyticus]
MRTVSSIQELRASLKEVRPQTIGFVPTMGYLHEGHLSLVDKAKETADVVVMSIFVNPLQFGPHEDLENYPRDLERDSHLAESRGVDILFFPPVEEMYPSGSKTTVSVQDITESMCGASRPGHFDGVTTVVAKLFNIVQPDYAFFGMKDAQQIAVVMQMVRDLNMPVEVVPCPIIREADGLALSSRNVYLSPEEREQALVLSRALQQVQSMVGLGERNVKTLRTAIEKVIQESPLASIDYIELRTYPGLMPIEELRGDCIVALAVRFGHTRLIDNIILAASQEEAACSVR